VNKQYACGRCGHDVFLSDQTAQLVRYFFALTNLKEIWFLCEECGDRILKSYRDPYGMGV
jgi:DNA-directed RNA polymerase subunit RPC12/RpoP